MLSALLVGLAYGPANPASSWLLARYTSSGNGRVFSLKQTAVPLGGAVAGLIVPFLMARIGWLGAALTVAAIGFAGAVVIGGWRDALDRDGNDLPPVGKTGAVAALRLVSASTSLRPLGIMAVCFAATQFNFTAVFAAVLVERMRWSPIEAGSTLSIALAVSVASRLVWGWIADHAPPAFRAGGAWRDDGSGNHRLRLFDAVMAERSLFTPLPFCSAHRARAGTAWHSPRPPTSRRQVMSAKPPPASCSLFIPAH